VIGAVDGTGKKVTIRGEYMDVELRVWPLVSISPMNRDRLDIK
jgi:hypothetical protein